MSTHILRAQSAHVSVCDGRGGSGAPRSSEATARLGRARARVAARGRAGRRRRGRLAARPRRPASSDDDPAAPPAGPAAVPPPPGLELPPLTEPAPVDTPLEPPGRIDAALGARPRWRRTSPTRPSAGTSSRRSPTSPPAGRWCGSATAWPRCPASTTKLLTATAALVGARSGDQVRDPGGRRRQGPDRAGRRRRPVPGVEAAARSAYPAHADVETLAAQTAAALRQQGRTKVTLGYDDSLFAEPSFNPAWPAHYLPEHVVSRITALWVDEGRPAGRLRPGRRPVAVRRRRPSPPRWSRHGIEVVGTPTHGVAGGWAASSPRCSRRRCARSSSGSSRSATTRPPRCSSHQVGRR